MGVWIEIDRLCEIGRLLGVTPCVGVWIEIPRRRAYQCSMYVTPCVGVWIEMPQLREGALQRVSLPAWECGLKLRRQTDTPTCASRHSLRGSVD